jgi:flagellar biosynthesis/type III secretory pathway M-ring protein FliF/YscJ
MKKLQRESVHLVAIALSVGVAYVYITWFIKNMYSMLITNMSQQEIVSVGQEIEVNTTRT